jgi:hypothetical protein
MLTTSNIFFLLGGEYKKIGERGKDPVYANAMQLCLECWMI